MKQAIKKSLCTLLAVVLMLTAATLAGFVGLELPAVDFAPSASAATSGNYTYSVSNGEATITDVSTYISGAITIPSTLGGYPVTSIGHSAFYNCTSLTSVTIPDSVTSIGFCAFSNCTKLTSVTIGDSVTSIGARAFEYCISLTSVTIGNSVTSIEYSAFSGCTSLTSVTIPDSVTSIGNSAFSNCTKLTSVTIPDSVTSIGGSAFNNTAYYNDKDNWIDGVLYIGIHLIAVDSTISGSYAIKAGTKSIAGSAFFFCTSLTSVTIPDSVTSIGNFAFYCCTSLTDITVDADNTAYCSEDGVLFNKSKTELIQYPVGNARTSYTIPDSVTSIGNYAFYNCVSLTDITIPDSVTSIGNWAFAYCDSLTSVIIGDSVTSIGNSAFSNCPALVIRSYLDSYAQQYAEEYDIPFIALNGEPTCILGDVDGDNEVTSSDARLALRAAVKLETLTEAQTQAADADKNGEIEAADARLILRAAVGLGTLQ